MSQDKMSDLVQRLVQASIWLIYSLLLNKRLWYLRVFFAKQDIFHLCVFFVLKPGMSQLRAFWSCLDSFTQTLRILLRFCAHICRKNWRLGLRTICLRTKCLKMKSLLDETSIRTKRPIAYKEVSKFASSTLWSFAAFKSHLGRFQAGSISESRKFQSSFIWNIRK